jgi:transcriptional regulator with XRE-family HTH domain
MATNAHRDTPSLIRALRERNGLTQEKLAARLGVSFSTINRWEKGRRRPSPLALRKLEEFVKDMRAGGVDLLSQHFPEGMS